MITDKLAGLETLTGLPVEENDYGGDEQEYVVWDVADERGGLFGNDRAQMLETNLQMRVRLQKETDYYPIKEQIQKYLEEEGFYGISFENNCEKESGNIFRYLIFEFNYAELKGE